MNFINTELVSESLTFDSCNFIPDKEYPFCIFGFQIRNAYDQSRLKIKSQYNVKDYVHFLPDSDATPTYFRGIRLTPNQSLLPLLTRINQLNTTLTDIPVKHYSAIISEFGMSCKNCYAHLQKGIYPIDGERITEFSKTKINIDDLYCNAFDTENVPLFQSIGYFTIFILNNKSIYRSGTDKIISDFRKNFC
jgi:hypothetical protein